mmetsp:Transcript_31114/g.66082  ORF Transcript_31114/g.66082 Transcript_31114/m.66082 type:complete len:478 (+) Transcript_31114:45-1478(+)|eukprot:CAMPEP_0171345136 /NCGR_PEP_ID=MMETSP0878-20121228/20904_1 /TAXON_ID=67004 /ORGANISM="Thalassiosira weissflogii, Strain CCMP1336" /LENGTH=477 /DNA_ID=CAMNT_0011848481 /DNA_START=42 /DNA_END=1475 /DNA_ORIENTATION=-
MTNGDNAARPKLPFLAVVALISCTLIRPSSGFVDVSGSNHAEEPNNDEHPSLPSASSQATEDEYDDDFFPPIADSDDISYFFSTYDLDGLHWALSNIFALSPRNPQNNNVNKSIRRELSPKLVSRGGGDNYTTEYKLLHDLEQARYLARVLKESKPSVADYFQSTVIPIYEEVLKNIPPLEDLSRTKGLYAFTKADYESGIGNVYNKALYIETADEINPTWHTQNGGSLLNNQLDFEGIQNNWFGHGQNSPTTSTTSIPGALVVDNLLSTSALQTIRQLLLRNTHWYQTKTPLEFGKYVGSYVDDGLHDPLFLQLAKQLHESMPRIMKGHELKYMWAYKYDSEWESGIRLHADQAAVNVNLWVSLDGADLEVEGFGGGLVVFTAKPPANWDFESYNTNTEFVIDHLLRPTNFANLTIAHKPNRAVIFDSALFHETDRYRFKKGYENGRINLTLLFGEMKMGDGDDGNAGRAHVGQEL